MSDTTTDEAVEVDRFASLSVGDLALRAAALKLLKERVTTEEAATRGALLAAQSKMYADTRSGKSVDAVLPTGQRVSTYTLAFDNDKAVVTDPEAFLEWVEGNRPDEVEIVPQVRASFTKAILDAVTFVKHTTDDGTEEYVAVLGSAGEVVSGVGLIKGSTDTPSTTAGRFTSRPAAAARTEDNDRTGRQILADWLTSGGGLAEVFDGGLLTDGS